MGCASSVPNEEEAAKSKEYMNSIVRSKYGKNILLLSIKDQNHPGKFCISGGTTPELEEQITKLLVSDAKNEKACQSSDKYDTMYDVTWRNTNLTTGMSMMSLQKSYFPRGKLFVALLNVIAEHGWALAAAPNFGGVESRDDKGNVTSCVDWPVFVFYREEAGKYAPGHLLLAVKDSNHPGKLCAAGPVAGTYLEKQMTAQLQKIDPKVVSEKDSYDDDFDVVWRNTSITSGASLMSWAKAYFPKGKTNVAILDTLYGEGWRAVAAPNFGGKGDSWPCVVFRKLQEPVDPPPEVILASIKDSNLPGKLCIAGKAASQVGSAILQKLQGVEGNKDTKLEKDEYDGDYDEVVRNVNITTGMAAFSMKLPYFPRCDSMKAFLEAMSQEGFGVVACPNFGGMLESWPTFVFESGRPPSEPVMFLAVKDDNIPGKLNLGGGGIDADSTLAPELLEVLQNLNGPQVEQTKDDYDSTFDFCFKKTKVTSGKAMFSMAKPYFPHGYVLEAVLTVLYSHGWKAAGGPNFGNDGGTWPGLVFARTSN